jgi:hypothetical protein
MVPEPTNTSIQPQPLSSELAGSIPIFARNVGSTIVTSTDLGDFRQRRLIFNHLDQPGRVHVYRADCRAGERLRVQVMTPVLPIGGSVSPAVAVIAQSLPYDADEGELPFPLPAGYSAVVASPPRSLLAPVRDLLTRAKFYPGPVVDTRTLVGGRCYIAVWSPRNQMGKYVLHVGYSWPLSLRYWLGVPGYWWRIRGWFGLSRMAAFAALGLLLLSIWLARMVMRRAGGQRHEQSSAQS